MAAEFPPGYLESYDGHKLVAICIAAIVLDVFFVAARFASRWIHNTPKGWDDLLMIPALLFSLLLAAEGLGTYITHVSSSSLYSICLDIQLTHPS